MDFPEKLKIKYKELDDFIMPIVKNVCYPRGEDDSSLYFEAYCPNCGQALNAKGLAYSASLLLSNVDTGYTECPDCGHPYFIATLKGLDSADWQRLLDDKFFSKIIRSGAVIDVADKSVANNSESTETIEVGADQRKEIASSEEKINDPYFGLILGISAIAGGALGASVLGFGFESEVAGLLGLFAGLFLGAIIGGLAYFPVMEKRVKKE